MSESASGKTVARGTEKAPGAFRTISEVSTELEVPQHVLRFWETKFIQVRPMKRGGGRRYYRPEDVAQLSHIRNLLYSDGYTIKGVQKLLREKGSKAEALESAAREKEGRSAPTAEPATLGDEKATQSEALRSILVELEDLRTLLTSPVK